MKIKAISLFICLVLIALCFIGCKDFQDINSDVLSDTETTSSVPIVIVDDQNESELDEVLEDWENNNPTVNIETDTADRGDNLNSSTNNSSDNSFDATTSKSQENNSSNDNLDSSDMQESSDNSSTDNSSDNSSNTSSEDDGYFDVAV